MAKTMIQFSDLVDINGSEKQIAWANKIRSEAITSIRSSLLGMQRQVQVGKVSEASANKRVEALLTVLNRHMEASWWIDNRQNYDDLIANEWHDEMSKES